MDERITYLNEISTLTKRDVRHIFKKEAAYWIEDILLHLHPMGVDPTPGRDAGFGINVKDKHGTRLIRYCYFDGEKCHVHFEAFTDVKKRIQKDLHLTENEFDFMLRLKFKAFLKKYNVIPLKRLKFFFKR